MKEPIKRVIRKSGTIRIKHLCPLCEGRMTIESPISQLFRQIKEKSGGLLQKADLFNAAKIPSEGRTDYVHCPVCKGEGRIEATYLIQDVINACQEGE